MGPRSFPRSKRLVKSSEFRQILDGGTKVVTSDLVVFARKSSTEQSRLGMIVSKKVGNAVSRNRVKRSIRQGFRCRPEGGLPLDLVVIARHGAASLAPGVVAQSLDRSLARLVHRMAKTPRRSPR